jgi:3-hydroxyacyl-CoA dehydrogenase
VLAWRNQFPDNPAFKKSEIVEKLNKEGKLGRKTGEGFYKYK